MTAQEKANRARKQLMARQASVVMAYARNTGQTSKATHRLFCAALDYAGGLQQFEVPYKQIGRRMLGPNKSESAWESAVSRDVATHTGERERSGYPGLRVVPGFRKEDRLGNVIESSVAQWDFEAMPYLAKMLEIARRLEKENRRLPYKRRLGREELFNEAFRLAEVPHEKPPDQVQTEQGTGEQTESDNEPDDEKIKAAIGRCVAYARSTKLKLIAAAASEQRQADTLALLHKELNRIWKLPPDELKRKLTQDEVAAMYAAATSAPPVEEYACTFVADDLSETPQSTIVFDGANPDFIGVKMPFFAKSGDTLAQAQAALTCLSSVGVETVNILLCDDAEHAKLTDERKHLRAEGLSADEIRRRGIDPQKAIKVTERVPIKHLRAALGEMMAGCVKRRWSFIVDPRSIGPRLIHVDECNKSVLDLLQDVSLYTIETSLDNGQAILILPDGLSESQCNEIEDRLFEVLKPLGCNKGSSGASRWPGSFNFKPKRQQSDGSFPQVKLLAFNPGRVVAPEELESLGLLAPRIEKEPPRPKAERTKFPTEWPVYDEALASRDRSGADYKFSCEAKRLGWTQAQVEIKLSELSDKAHERSRRRSDSYLSSTVKKAFNAPGNVPVRFGCQSTETGVI